MTSHELTVKYFADCVADVQHKIPSTWSAHPQSSGDVCPSYQCGSLVVWINHREARLREAREAGFGQIPRFVVTDTLDDTTSPRLQTNTFDEVVQYVSTYALPINPITSHV